MDDYLKATAMTTVARIMARTPSAIDDTTAAMRARREKLEKEREEKGEEARVVEGANRVPKSIRRALKIHRRRAEKRQRLQAREQVEA